MFQGSSPAGLPLALDGYVDSELATEVDDTLQLKKLHNESKRIYN